MCCGLQNRERLRLDALLEQHKQRRNAEEASKLSGMASAGSSPQLPPFGAMVSLLYRYLSLSLDAPFSVDFLSCTCTCSPFGCEAYFGLVCYES